MTESDLFEPVAGNRLAHFEDCRSAIDQLFFEAFTARGSSAFDEFLNFVIRFNNLSIYNAMLVLVQRPGSGAVATRRRWQDFGREIKLDAIPIVVLQPFGPVSFLFEQADTIGRPMLGEEHNPLLAKGSLSQQIYDKTCAAAKRFQIEVEETDRYGTLLAGTAVGINTLPYARISINSKTHQYLRVFQIRLNSNHDLPTRYATLAHELGHIYCGHVGADSKGRWPDRRGLSVEQKEVEAEAVAWLVCKRLGIETRSPQYLREIIDKTDLSCISMYAIFEAANRVESRTDPKGR